MNYYTYVLRLQRHGKAKMLMQCHDERDASMPQASSHVGGNALGFRFRHILFNDNKGMFYYCIYPSQCTKKL